MNELTPICQMKDLHLGGSTTCRRESLKPEGCDVVDRLKSEMLQVEDVELVGAKGLTDYLIDLINGSVVNVYVISKGFLLVSLVTKRGSLEEVCFLNFVISKKIRFVYFG